MMGRRNKVPAKRLPKHLTQDGDEELSQQREAPARGRKRRLRISKTNPNVVPDKEQATHAALSNVVILDKIFDFHPLPKELRLLCKTWNDAFLSGKSRLYVNLCSILHGHSPRVPCPPNEQEQEVKNTTEFKERIASLDPRLVKTLTLDNKIVTLSGNGISIPTALLLICQKLGPNLAELSVRWGPEIVPTLYQILTCCSNIKFMCLSITALEDSPGFVLPANPASIPIPTNPKLKRLAVSNDDEKVGLYSSILFQNILTAAPKLAELNLRSVALVDLSGNTVLQRLTFKSKNPNVLHQNEDDFGNLAHPTWAFNVTTLPSVLDSVKGSLEQLVLQSVNSHPPCPKCVSGYTFQLPAMPRLKSLEIKNSQVFRSHFSPGQLGKEGLPSLKFLSLANVPTHAERPNIGSEIGEGFLQQGSPDVTVPMVTVEALSLKWVDSDVLQSLCQTRSVTFPHLQRLDLALENRKRVENTREEFHNYTARLGKAIESCSKLGLKDLRIMIMTDLGWNAGLVQCLWEWRSNFFQGLETLDIYCFGHWGNDWDPVEWTEDIEQKFEDVLMLTKQMKSAVFRGFVLRAGHAHNLFELISLHKLPVKFDDLGW